MRHFDFTRIHDEFVNYYKTLEKGESEYYSWLRALSLDESKPYGQSRESFTWSKDMLRFVREDVDNKYYEVIVGLPWRSMNGNVYKERDLIAASLSLEGKSPSLNHKVEFWFSPKNPQNRWGNLTVVEGKYQDGASGVLLKVPKTAICPICNGAKMTELIDKQHIVNVSLEGSMEGAFEYTDPPFTLLTSDVLPGIPLARIKPLETIMVEALQVSTGKRKMIKPRIIEENITQPKVNVDTDSNNPNFKGTMGTPVNADAKIDTQADLAKTAMGTPAAPDNLNMTVSKAESKVAEPFADYTSWDDCISKNSDKDNPDAYCASIKAQTEAENLKEGGTSMPKPEDIRTGPTKSKPPVHSDILLPEGAPSSLPSHVKPSVVMGESPGKVGVVTGTSPVTELLNEQVNRIRAETREAIAHDETEKLRESVKKVEVIWADKYMKLSEEYQKQQAINVNQEQILTEQKDAIRKEQLRSEDLRVEMRDIKNQFADTTSISNKQGHLIEDLKIENAGLNKKYNGALQTNLELSQKLTAANEDYLVIAKKLQETEEALSRARNEAKKIVRITA